MLAEGIEPEMISEYGIADGDMTRHALVEACRSISIIFLSLRKWQSEDYLFQQIFYMQLLDAACDTTFPLPSC